MMETITITSKNPRPDRLTVKLPANEYADYLARYSTPDRARAEILNDAGRVEKHRAILAACLQQQLTDDQRQQVERLAFAYARQQKIYNEIAEQGYGNYLDRALRGGLMPESWGRICARAATAIGGYEIGPTDADRDAAMRELDLYTDQDQEWSEQIATIGQTWIIERSPLQIPNRCYSKEGDNERSI